MVNSDSLRGRLGRTTREAWAEYEKPSAGLRLRVERGYGSPNEAKIAETSAGRKDRRDCLAKADVAGLSNNRSFSFSHAE